MIPFSLFPSPSTSCHRCLFVDVQTFSLECNPAWTGGSDLQSNPLQSPLTQSDFAPLLSNTSANFHKCLPRCEFFLREELLCAAISISSQNTLIILIISRSPFFSFTRTSAHTHMHTHSLTTGCTANIDNIRMIDRPVSTRYQSDPSKC